MVNPKLLFRGYLVSIALIAAAPVPAQQLFQLPTANRAIFDPANQGKFFVETVGRTWTSGCFGCVRSEGWQMHEGLDIRCLQRDKRNEPIDPVLATADGTVTYINRKSPLSNYGNYVVLRHEMEGIEVYSLYAHIQAPAASLKVGQNVKAGETIALMGRTTNTREGISKERAHVHFEINLLVSERFTTWFKKQATGERNDHGNWNGQNLLGLDPRLVFLGQQKGKFSLAAFLREQTELCRVVVRDTDFPWLKRYSALVQPRAAGAKDPIAGYELVLNYNGVPFQVIPRTAAEIKSKGRYSLLSVNAAEYKKNPCRRLVIQRGGRWELTSRATRLLDLMTY